MNLNQLRELFDLGFSLIPLNAWNEGEDDKKGKAPKDGLKWEKFQFERADWKTIEKWFKPWNNCNWGIICGEVSGNLTVIDFDDPEIYHKIFPKHDELEQEMIVVKTGRGYQVYLKGIAESKDIHTKEGKILFEVRSNGRYVVAPGSKHKNGTIYTILGSTKITEVEDITQTLIEKAEKVGYKIKNKPEIDIEAILKGINKGDRDNSLVRLITFLRKTGKKESEALKICQEWNTRNKPRLEDSVIEDKVKYHYQRDKPYHYFFKQNPSDYDITDRVELLKKGKIDRQNGDSQASSLIKYVESSDVELFHDDVHDPYIRVSIDGHYPILPIKGRGFKRWITQQYYKDTGKAPGNDAFSSALNVIEAKACFDGKQQILHNRLCWYDGAIFFDLGTWEAVKITSQGWEIVKNTPILFKKYKHQKSIDTPPFLQKSDVKKALEFVNIKDEKDKLLFVVYLISCFIPDIPHVIAVVHGDKGAAKSTLFKIVKELVDPSTLKILTFPKDNTELVQKLSHHYYAGFDNVTKLSDWQSDALCRACTGEGFSKRELYTDDEDVIYSFQRCIGLNGINVVATKPDLLDRSILLRLERIPKKDRKTEAQLWQAFDKVKGEILSGIFTTLSSAMAIYPSIKLDELPRMADFTVWGCAIAEALECGKDAFLDAYNTNIQAQNREAIEGSPVGELILKFMEDKSDWEGRASELLTLLEGLAGANKVNIKAKSFPKAAHVLTKRLNEIKTNLIDEGITYEQKPDGKRTLVLYKSTENSVSSVKASGTKAVEGTKTDAIEKTKRPYDNVVASGSKAKSETDATEKNQKGVASVVASVKKQDGEALPDATYASDATLLTSKGKPSMQDIALQINDMLTEFYGCSQPSKEGIVLLTSEIKVRFDLPEESAKHYLTNAMKVRGWWVL